MKIPLFSIIIVNFNGKEYLDSCVASVLKNKYENFEIIVVDNGSKDGSVSLLKKKYRKCLNKIKIVELQKNFGPAKARNEGVKVASGVYIGFLDNDTQVHKNWISSALETFKINKNIGIVQSKILLNDDRRRIDYVGEYLGNFGFLVSSAAYGEIDNNQYNQNSKILAAKSAGMFIRKKVFDEIGGFDEDYFIFVEETDLGWRSWLKGYECVFCPSSIVYHNFSSTKNIVDKKFNTYLIRFHGCKNYLMTLIKNLSLLWLIKILPVHIFLWICLSLYFLIKGNINSSINIFKGILWNIYNIKSTLKKRTVIQNSRVISDEDLFFKYMLMKKISLSYYFNKFIDSQKKNLAPEGIL